MKSAALTDPGCVHDENEDAYFADDSRGLWIVSDGVGSHRGAGVASRWVVEAVASALSSPRPSGAYEVRRWLTTAVRSATARLATEARRDPSLLMMTATLTLLQAMGEEHVFVQVGDSRGYRLRGGAFEQITNDHSVAFEQYKFGAIRKEQIQGHPNQRLLTRTIGAERDVVPEITIAGTQAGDRFLLCSDGLTKELADEEIEELMRETHDPAVLVEAAKARGGRDNITVVLVDAGDHG